MRTYFGEGMDKGYQRRKKILNKIQKHRKGRIPICFFNFDRESMPAGIPGLKTGFASDTKEIIYRLLKDAKQNQGFDLILYTRGGDLNSVWPIVSLIREYDPCFEVLVPYRCHSSGTLLALGARKIHMTRLGELSPIDPSTFNAFNPENKSGAKIPISVEDVTAYFQLVESKNGEKQNGSKKAKKDDSGSGKKKDDNFSVFESLSKSDVHPLALGNIHRVYQQTRQLAEQLLETNQCSKKGKKSDIKAIVEKLSTGFYSHSHPISRVEAKNLLGSDQLNFTNDTLEGLMDSLLKSYEDTFSLRERYILNEELISEKEKKVQYIGAIVESELRSYVFASVGTWYKRTIPPKGLNINIQPGAVIPEIPGWPNDFEFKPKFQDWKHNQEEI